MILYYLFSGNILSLLSAYSMALSVLALVAVHRLTLSMRLSDSIIPV